MKANIVKVRNTMKPESIGKNFKIEVYSDQGIYMCKIFFIDDKLCILPNQYMVAVVDDSASPLKMISFQSRLLPL